MIGQGELRTPHASRLTPHASRRALTRTKTICPPFGGHNDINAKVLINMPKYEQLHICHDVGEPSDNQIGPIYIAAALSPITIFMSNMK